MVGSGVFVLKESGCVSLYASLTALVMSPKDAPRLIDADEDDFCERSKSDE